MNTPQLKNGQYAVKQTTANAADVNWFVYDSLQAACQYAATDIGNHPLAEYAIYNSDGEHLQTFNKQAVDKFAAEFIASYKKRPKQWWEFWK